jgi:hypothetical protein
MKVCCKSGLWQNRRDREEVIDVEGARVHAGRCCNNSWRAGAPTPIAGRPGTGRLRRPFRPVARRWLFELADRVMIGSICAPSASSSASGWARAGAASQNQLQASQLRVPRSCNLQASFAAGNRLPISPLGRFTADYTSEAWCDGVIRMFIRQLCSLLFPFA